MLGRMRADNVACGLRSVKRARPRTKPSRAALLPAASARRLARYPRDVVRRPEVTRVYHVTTVATGMGWRRFRTALPCALACALAGVSCHRASEGTQEPAT